MTDALAMASSSLSHSVAVGDGAGVHALDDLADEMRHVAEGN